MIDIAIFLAPRYWLSSFLVCSLCANMTYADESLFDLSLGELMSVQVTTASKRSESIDAAPAFVYVISRNDIVMRGYAVLSDVLRDLPGFDTTEYGRAELGTEIAVRGVVGNNKTILLIDGVRANSPGGEPLQVRGDISVRHAKRIEVVYGAGSTLYGQDAINAVINIITEDGTTQKGWQGVAVAGENSYQEAYLSYANAFTITNNETLLVSGYIQWLNTDLTQLNDAYPDWWQALYDGTVAKAEGADPAIRWDEGMNVNVNLETSTQALRVWYRNSSRSTSDGSTNASLFNRLASWEDEALMLNFSQVNRFTDRTNLNSSLTHKTVEVDPESRFVVLRRDGQSYFTNRKYALASGTTLEERLDINVNPNVFLMGGFVWENHNTLVKTSIPEGEFDAKGNVVLQAGEFAYYTEAGNPDSLVIEARATEIHYQNYGVFVEGNYKYNNDLAFVIGARRDWDSNTNDSPFSFRFAANYTLLPGLMAKYIYAEAFTAAAPYYAYVNFGTPDAIVTNNHQLEPEESVSHELNLSWQAQYGFVGLSVYNNHQTNLIQESRERFSFNVVADPVYLDEDGLLPRTLVQSANGGESTAIGGDLYARLSLRDTLSLWGSYSYVDFKATADGETRGLQNISRHNVRFGLTYKINHNIWLTPSLVYRSTPENFQSLRALDDEIENPYWLNLMVKYQPIANVEGFIRIDNLTDNRIALRGSGGPLPQEARSVRVGLTYRY